VCVAGYRSADYTWTEHESDSGGNGHHEGDVCRNIAMVVNTTQILLLVTSSSRSHAVVPFHRWRYLDSVSLSCSCNLCYSGIASDV